MKRRSAVVVGIAIVGVVAVWTILQNASDQPNRQSDVRMPTREAAADEAEPVDEDVDPAEIVAQALDVDTDQVRITRDPELRDDGRIVRVFAAVDYPEEPVRGFMVEYEADTHLLRGVLWMGVPEWPAEPGTYVPVEEAREVAEQLKSRLFPSVPVEMTLLDIGAVGDGVYKAHSFRWGCKIAEDVFTSDEVRVTVNAATGKPRTYSQRVAAERPELEDIAVTREQAIEIATEHIVALWRRDMESEVSFEVAETRLELSSPRSPDGGPVWWITGYPVIVRTGDRMMATIRPICAMTGELLL